MPALLSTQCREVTQVPLTSFLLLVYLLVSLVTLVTLLTSSLVYLHPSLHLVYQQVL